MERVAFVMRVSTAGAINRSGRRFWPNPWACRRDACSYEIAKFLVSFGIYINLNSELKSTLTSW